MIIDPTNQKHIIAEEGMVFKRIGHSDIFGNEMYLGYSYYIDGILQDPPHEDKIEEFEEIPDPDPIEPEEQ